VQGYGLTTANILYRRPDHPWLLQSYVWQNYDLYPDFPELQSFFEVLAEIPRRRPAFGHGCAFPAHQTGRDQDSGWSFQASLINDRIDQRPLSLSRMDSGILLDAPIERTLHSNAFVIWREVCFRIAEIRRYLLH
jgi:hypothetical protein